jgi:hypothetical protein
MGNAIVSVCNWIASIEIWRLQVSNNYFLEKWLNRFDKSKTKSEMFRLVEVEKIRAVLLHRNARGTKGKHDFEYVYSE